MGHRAKEVLFLLAFATAACESAPVAETLQAVTPTMPRPTDVIPLPTATSTLESTPTATLEPTLTPEVTEVPFTFRFDWPVKGGVVNQDFPFLAPFSNEYGDPAHHTGVDIRKEQGAAVLAAGNGVCVFAQEVEDLGNTIILEHHIVTVEGEKNIYTLYGHLDTILAEVGEYYALGDDIGTLGSTGLPEGLQNAEHLHFEIFRARLLAWILIHGPNRSAILDVKDLEELFIDPQIFMDAQGDFFLSGD